MTCPGLPDFYQGAELWDLNLVDPDNRRGVDFKKRTRFLKEIRETQANAANQLLHKLMTSKKDGRIKLFLIHKGLHARVQNRTLFQAGDYLPASASGKRADHVVAFFRVYGNRFALIVVPRFLTSLIRPDESPLGRPVWEDTTIHLPAGVPSLWRDALTGDTVQTANDVPVGDILTTCPVSVLLGRSGRHRS
jgi:(1->4)-alpha-D-glucan 1-alpha-D-glucosylmutase